VSFRARLTLVAAAAVALAVVLASVVVWLVVRNQLYRDLDHRLRTRATEIAHGPLHTEPGPNGEPILDVGPGTFLGSDYVQAVWAGGRTLRTYGETKPIPVDSRTLAAARGSGDAYFTDSHVGETKVRVLTVPGPGVAIQVARPLGEVDHTMHRITLFLLLIAAGGIAVAAALGLLVSRAALAPVRRLTQATETVTATGDLSERIEGGGSHDELGRLASSFNTMLGALEESTRAQSQLVADASHELRTPLTSLRTNIEVLASERSLPPGERERLLSDVVDQLEEMTTLVAELIELARGEREPAQSEEVRLDLVAADAVERTRRHRPGITFTTDLRESVVHGVPATIERAVANLLDNAAKWSPPGGEVQVTVRDGEVTVRDHGPGIDEEDLPYVFDRFYRASSARGMSGSGLGLAIVRQVAEAHGGSVVAERPEDGGTLMRLRLDGAGDLESSS
jgi:two-component system, OmpR family, sensor histidine kinase MprB